MTDLDSLIDRTVSGDAEAWRRLQAELAPLIASIAQSHRTLRAKGLAAQPDDVAEVQTSTLERLARQEFHSLKRFLEQRAQNAGAQSFDSWLYGAVDFAIREHLRRRFGRAPKQVRDDAQQPQPSKRDLQSHAARLEAEPERGLLQTLSMTARLTVAQILAHVAQDFEESEARVIRLYYVEDADLEQIARVMGLRDAKDAERLLRKLNARLRYRFAQAGEG